MQQFADDLANLLDQLSVQQPVRLCGLSMGGYIAWQFWRRHGDRLSHLILCDTPQLRTRQMPHRGDVNRPNVCCKREQPFWQKR